jgi:DNA-binding LacI/PurR family transcriptional regulator
MPASPKRTTLSDVAVHAGVSKATVSAVLNASAAVRAATRERVLAAAEVLDYRLPAVGGAAAGRRATRALGLVIKEDDNPYYAGLVAGVRAVADAHGYVLLVASSEGDVRAERRAVELLQAKDVDGLLLTPVLGDEAEADLSPLFDLKRRGVPFVLLESVRGVPASLVDVTTCGRRAPRPSTSWRSGTRGWPTSPGPPTAPTRTSACRACGTPRARRPPCSPTRTW